MEGQRALCTETILAQPHYEIRGSSFTQPVFMALNVKNWGGLKEGQEPQSPPLAANRKDSNVNNQLLSMLEQRERPGKGFTAKQPKQISDKTEHPKRTGEGMERGSCTWAQNQGWKESGSRGPWGAIDSFSPVEWYQIWVFRMQILTAQYRLKVGEHLEGLCRDSRNE